MRESLSSVAIFKENLNFHNKLTKIKSLIKLKNDANSKITLMQKCK